MPRTIRPRTTRQVKTTLSLPAESAQILRDLADQRGSTLAEVIRRALKLEEYLTRVRETGGRLLVKDEKEEITELLIF
jgi:hypothetical protein